MLACAVVESRRSRPRIVEKEERFGRFQWPRVTAMLCSAREDQPIVCGASVEGVKSVAECVHGAKEPPRMRSYLTRRRGQIDVFGCQDRSSGSMRQRVMMTFRRRFARCFPARDVPPPRRFSDRLRGRACLRRAPPKGLQAFRIRSMDDLTAVHPSQLPQRTHVIVIPESNSGQVKWSKRLRGFGFDRHADRHLRAWETPGAVPPSLDPDSRCWSMAGDRKVHGCGAKAGRRAGSVLSLTTAIRT
jgi:hypothetical protein